MNLPENARMGGKKVNGGGGGGGFVSRPPNRGRWNCLEEQNIGSKELYIRSYSVNAAERIEKWMGKL